MKHIKKCLLAMILLCTMILPHFAYAAEISVTDLLQELIAYEYPEGYVFNTSFDGGTGCFGFAKLIVNRLFGEDSNGKIRSWNYAGESSTGMIAIDRLYDGQYSAENVRNMMKKARPGCVIQRNVDATGASQHSMIFLSAGEDSFQIYDCNARYDNVVHIREIGYDDWEGRTFLNVTLLMPDNYPDGSIPPTPEVPDTPLQNDAQVLARLQAMMATGLPIGSIYENGNTTDEKNVLFAEEVLSQLFGTTHHWSRVGVPLENMQLVDRVFYGEYDDAERLSELFSKASPGDVIQLGTGPYDRAHCMIFLSADTESVWVYDADRSNDSMIRKRNLPYATRFPNGTWQNISLLRASDHPTPISLPDNNTDDDPAPETIHFIDVPETHWAHGYIAGLTQRGITRGKDPSHFAPDETITRAEFIVFLSRMGDITKLGTGSTELSDISDNAWYANAVRWANSHGIARGDENGYFHPNAPVTREDLCVMLVRFMNICGYTPNGTQSADSFFDRASIANYARDSVDALTRAGIVSGKRDGFFVPKDNATRAECAKILYKSLLFMEKSES